MNVCFKAEAAVAQAMIASTTDPGSEPTKELCAVALRLNSEILSGKRGNDVLVAFTEALEDFRSAAWKGLPLSDDVRFESACHMLCALGSAWRRLCDFADQPRFRIFDVCHIGGKQVFDSNHIKRVIDPLVALQAICEDCIDREFTGKLLPPLRSGQLPLMREAVSLLADILTCLRASSVSVERAHLPAEESKPTRSRGRAMEIKTVAAHTYRRFVREEHGLVHQQVLHKVLAGAGLSYTQFSACLRGGSFGHVDRVGRARLGQRQPRALAGIDVFRSETWNREVKGKIGSPDHVAEMKRVVEAWVALSDAEREYFQRRAARETSARADVRQQGRMQSVDELGLRSNARQAMLRDVARHAMGRLVEHPAWQAGLGVWSHSSAVDAILIARDRQGVIQAFDEEGWEAQIRRCCKHLHRALR